MRALINKVVSKLKGETFVLDSKIPISYLLRFFGSKAVSLIWGMIRFRSLKRAFIHPTATIKCSKMIHYGNNLSIDRNCFINAVSADGLWLGNNVSMGFHTHIELSGSLKMLGGIMKVGDNVGLGSHGHFGTGAGKIIIGNNCIFGNYVSIHPENHIYNDIVLPIRLQGVSSKGGVIIGDNCWIGAKATILDGTSIGSGCIIAAGAVVSGTFPDYSIIGGVPAKIIKMRK